MKKWKLINKLKQNGSLPEEAETKKNTILPKQIKRT